MASRRRANSAVVSNTVTIPDVSSVETATVETVETVETATVETKVSNAPKISIPDVSSVESATVETATVETATVDISALAEEKPVRRLPALADLTGIKRYIPQNKEICVTSKYKDVDYLVIIDLEGTVFFSDGALDNPYYIGLFSSELEIVRDSKVFLDDTLESMLSNASKALHSKAMLDIPSVVEKQQKNKERANERKKENQLAVKSRFGW